MATVAVCAGQRAVDLDFGPARCTVNICKRCKDAHIHTHANITTLHAQNKVNTDATQPERGVSRSAPPLTLELRCLYVCSFNTSIQKS